MRNTRLWRQLQVTSAAPSPDMPEVILHRHVALEVAAYGPGQSMVFGKVDCGRDGVSANPRTQKLLRSKPRPGNP